ALAFMQTHVSLAPTITATGTLAKRLDLRLDVDQIHRSHLDVEQRFHSGFHVALVGVGSHFENILVVFLHARSLFGHMRCAQHAIQALVLDFATFHVSAHASHSSIFFTDSTVTSTLSASTRLTGSIAATSTTARCGRLRADRNRF